MSKGPDDLITINEWHQSIQEGADLIEAIPDGTRGMYGVDHRRGAAITRNIGYFARQVLEDGKVTKLNRHQSSRLTATVGDLAGRLNGIISFSPEQETSDANG